MESKETKSGGGIGFCGLLAIVFIVLRLTKIIAWSWCWVLAPIWSPVVIVIVAAILLGVIEAFKK